MSKRPGFVSLSAVKLGQHVLGNFFNHLGNRARVVTQMQADMLHTGFTQCFQFVNEGHPSASSAEAHGFHWRARVGFKMKVKERDVRLVPGEFSPQASHAPAAPTVTVSKPVKSVITDWDSFTGRFEATDSVDVRSRVSGYLEKVAFQDGAIVKKGDLLFVIDSRSFQAAVVQAQGKLAQVRSQLALAEQEFARANVLIESKTIARSLYDQRLQARQAAQAEVLSAEGALSNAKLDLEFTRITAPMSGRISRKLISEGNPFVWQQQHRHVLPVEWSGIHGARDGCGEKAGWKTRLIS